MLVPDKLSGLIKLIICIGCLLSLFIIVIILPLLPVNGILINYIPAKIILLVCGVFGLIFIGSLSMFTLFILYK